MSALRIPKRSEDASTPQLAASSCLSDPYADADSEALFEVVRGEKVEKTMSVYELYLGGRLFRAIANHCEATDLGHALIETMFAIPHSGNDRRPDVAFVSYQSWPKDRVLPRVNAWPVAPDLVAEVVSPSDEMFNVLEKVEEYFAGGVKQVWLVFSHIERVYCYSSPTEVRVLSRADELSGDPVIPGFRLPLATLFPGETETSAGAVGTGSLPPPDSPSVDQ